MESERKNNVVAMFSLFFSFYPRYSARGLSFTVIRNVDDDSAEEMEG